MQHLSVPRGYFGHFRFQPKFEVWDKILCSAIKMHDLCILRIQVISQSSRKLLSKAFFKPFAKVNLTSFTIYLF